MLKFISFSAMSSASLNNKVNAFFSHNHGIEIVDVKYAASFGSVYAAVLYR